MSLIGTDLRGRNAYDAIPGVRELALLCGVELAKVPTMDEIQEHLFPLWGNAKYFEQNASKVAQALALDGTMVPDASILKMLESTQTLDTWQLSTVAGLQVRSSEAQVVILTGGTDRWKNRRIAELIRQVDLGLRVKELYVLANETDAEFYRRELLRQTGLIATAYLLGSSLEEQVRKLGEEHPEIYNSQVLVITNANASYVPLLVRRILRDQNAQFDAEGNQFSWVQDGFPLAKTPEQAADPDHYQRPLTVFSGLVRLLHELYLLQ